LKRDAWGKFDENGNRYQITVNEDMDRMYDEAVFQVFDTRLKMGLTVPKASRSG